jgi:hypothetical protein
MDPCTRKSGPFMDQYGWKSLCSPHRVWETLSNGLGVDTWSQTEGQTWSPLLGDIGLPSMHIIFLPYITFRCISIPVEITASVCMNWFTDRI